MGNGYKNSFLEFGDKKRLAIKHFYSNTTVAPTDSSVCLIFSASALGTPSLMTLGADSTNFLASWLV
jgi:hypothetical protein